MPQKKRKKKKKLEPGVCPKCETKNPENAKFCNSCGARLQVVVKGGFEGLVALHTVAALYVLLSVTFNRLVQASPIFLSLYVVAGVLGLGGAYALNAGKIKTWTKFLSLAMVVVGIVGTTLLFILGLTIEGVVGPAWVIFLATAWKLWQDRHSL